MDLLLSPWPWYIAGPLIGLTVPLLLLLGNKSFGVSANLRHICAACIPIKVPFFQYDWKRESWNLFFVGGIFGGALISYHFLGGSRPADVSPATVAELSLLGVKDFTGLNPVDLFGVSTFSMQGILLTAIGGFLVGFGTRYAGGCTSGHSITGLSTLQWPSLVATIAFMAGGFLMTLVILPLLLAR